MRVELRDEIAAVMRPRVEDQLKTFLEEDESLRKLSEPGKYRLFKAMLFNELPILDSPVRRSFCDLLTSAVFDEKGLRDVEALEDLLISALAYKNGDVGRDDAILVIKDDELLRLFWTAICSRELLPQRILRLLGVRQRFIDMGASAEIMSLDDQLLAQSQLFEINREEIMGAIS